MRERSFAFPADSVPGSAMIPLPLPLPLPLPSDGLRVIGFCFGCWRDAADARRLFCRGGWIAAWRDPT